jgi:glutamate--cysteine ligase
MERYFTEVSPAGLRMMSLTASLQLNIDFGPDPSTTWKHAHVVAPVLAAAFANSPTTDGTRWRPVSHRQQIWAATDPSRTRPVGAEPGDWRRYVLDAKVMLREGPAGIELAPERRSFAEWLGGHEPPTIGELELHLTTLFPPLRPRGYLELRMIDALPAPGRAAAIATVWALLTDARAGDEAADECRALTDPWAIATEEGLGNPGMRTAAATLLDIAAHHSPRVGSLREACANWHDRVCAGGGASTVVDLVGDSERGAAASSR